MATESKLKEDIKKLETAINGKAPEKLKAKFKNQLAILKAELSALQKPAASKMSRAKQLRAKYKALYGVRFQGIDIEKDADIPARAIGKRTSKGLKGNQYVSKAQAKGHTYYEYRENRIDMKQPPKKYPKLEDGGYMAKGGNITPKEKMIKELQKLQRELNSSRLSQYREGDESDNEKSRQRERASKLARFNEILDVLHQDDNKMADGGMMAKGGNVVGKSGSTYKLEMWDSFDDMVHEKKKPYKIVYSENESKLRDLSEEHQEKDGSTKLYKKRNGKYMNIATFLEDGGYMAKGGEVNFYDIVDSIKYLEYDGDPSDLRLFSDERFNWGADNPEDYEKAEKEIDNIKYKGNGWEIYATYDGSSYSYWMESQEEQNYISIVILFQKEKIDKSEIEKIKEALQDAHDDAENIADKYDYNPSNYAKGGKTQGYDDREDERLAMKYGKIKSKYLDSTKARRDDARFEERGKMEDGGIMAEGGLVVKSDEDLREIANYMAKAVKKRWDLKDLVYYFEQENNYDYKYRVKIWDEMNVYEMKKTEENIYKVLKAIVEANKGGKMADGGMMAEGGAVNEDNMEMVVSQIKAIKHHAEELSKIVTPSTPIEAWVVAKIERAETDLSDVTHYLDGLKMEHGGRVSSSQHRLNR
jgi:hypothetical protein